MMRAPFGLVLLALSGAPGLAQAQGSAPDAGSAASTDLAPRVEAIEQQLEELQRENARLKSKVQKLQDQPPEPGHLLVPDGVKLRVDGYVDVGFFAAQGDGVAYVRDDAKQIYPEYKDFPWVFAGDPWANPVNSQGESADLGLDRTNIRRFDPIQSGGKPSFIVNMVNLDLVASAGEHLLAEASFNLEPRQGLFGSPGDYMDVDLAYLEWIPSKTLDLHIFAGKFESTFGVEYRERKAPDRVGITPSLIARYTTGNPIGLKVRGSVIDGWVTYNVAVTNGSTSTELFGHFYNELDKNLFKTVSGRLSIGHKFDSVFFDLGGSGMYGAQDLQPDDNVHQFQVGADARLTIGDFSLRAEFLRSVANEHRVPGIPWLRVNGAYGEMAYQFLPWLAAMARADYRHALLFAETNLYVTNTWRFTGALRFDISWNAFVKLEYLRIQEYKGPEINDDVFTSSLVFRF